MKLIIDTIHIENLESLDTIIFSIGLVITVTFILFKIFGKGDVTNETEQDYYSRHNTP